MNISPQFFFSKVARQFFVLFILCALIPIAALSVLTFFYVENELNQQNKAFLHHFTKSAGMEILERLLYLDKGLKIAEKDLVFEDGSLVLTSRSRERLLETISDQFSALGIMRDGRIQTVIYGSIDPRLDLNVQKNIHSDGKTIIRSLSQKKMDAHIYLLRPVSGQLKSSFIIGRVNSAFLWGQNDDYEFIPYMTDMTVLKDNNQRLHSSSEAAGMPDPKFFQNHIAGSAFGQFEYRSNGLDQQACFWTLFLNSRFSGENWCIILSQDKAAAQTPMSFFKEMYPMVLLLSFWVVLLLSLISIRKSLFPLAKLREATQRIAQRNFNTQVKVDSKDEFADLADAFNLMSNKLDRQFHTLTAIADIDRMILSSLETEKIIEIVLTRMKDIIACHEISICLSGQEEDLWYVFRMKKALLKEVVSISDADVHLITSNRHHMALPLTKNSPRFLLSAFDASINSVIVLPVFSQSLLSGMIILGFRSAEAFNTSDIEEARQIADHIAIALSKADLIHDLDRLNWGTMMALARTVDAKSPWTAGHSERVTQLSLRIGDEIGIAQSEIDILHRAGLLHDIGKVGIPLSILDKGEELDESEREIVKLHPITGARILEPIGPYEKVVPIVFQHHERFDGSGYPLGLCGKEILLGARILAVADVYDALFNSRPYRKGWQKEEVIDYIRKNAGVYFDPEIVDAFLSVIRTHPA